MLKKAILSLLIFFSYVIAYDITPIIGTPSIVSLNSKKDKGCSRSNLDLIDSKVNILFIVIF